MIAWNRASLHSLSLTSSVIMLAQFHEIPIQVGQLFKRGKMLFWAYTYLGILQKQSKHGSSKHVKKWTNNLCK